MSRAKGGHGLWRSFVFAAAGIAVLLRTEHNARLHAAASGVVVGLAIWLRLGRYDWALLILAIALVWSAEAMNTAVERLADRVSNETDLLIGKAKDLAAGAVLIATFGAVAIGLLVLGPPLWTRIAG